jgi:thiol-disulfide isomerase/thioredoxin
MNFRALAHSLLLLATLVPVLAQLAAPPTVTAAAPAPAAAGTPAGDLELLVTQIRAKLGAGVPTATSLAPELAAFDALLAKYRSQKTDDVALILYMQATLHGEVLQDLVKMKELLLRLQADFPSTKSAAAAQATLTALERQTSTREASATLVGKPAAPLHFSWASPAGLKTLADLRGKVVVLDFWATWCGPCVASFPQMRELTAHYRGLDVVVLGVTSIQGSVIGLGPERIDTKDNPSKEMALMTDYIKAKDITWPIAFSEEAVFNPDYAIRGIPHMAIVAPDGILRHSGLHPAMPHAEKVEKIDALLREFKLPVVAPAPAK